MLYSAKQQRPSNFFRRRLKSRKTVGRVRRKRNVEREKTKMFAPTEFDALRRCHDAQHNDTQRKDANYNNAQHSSTQYNDNHNDTQHNGTWRNDTQHK
jgi:hypothetical protein